MKVIREVSLESENFDPHLKEYLSKLSKTERKIYFNLLNKNKKMKEDIENIINQIKDMGEKEKYSY